MKRAGFWFALALGLIGLLACTGGWLPLGLLGGIPSTVALVVGPLILIYVALKGPPDRTSGSRMAGTLFLTLLGLLLTIAGLIKLSVAFLAA